MKQQLGYFFGAVRFFTRLPLPAWVGHETDHLDHALRYFPLIGLIVGGIGAGVTELTAWVLPASVAILLGMIATLLATGGFHEDGLADCCDGFGGGRDTPKILAIMKDSRVGSYAVLGVGLMLLLKWNALSEIDLAFGPLQLAATLVAAHAASRFAPLVLVVALDYVRDDASSKSRPVVQRMSKTDLGFAAITALLPCLLLPPADALTALAAVGLTTALAARYFHRRLGGYTGDCLGATQQLSEMAFYLGVLCSFT